MSTPVAAGPAIRPGVQISMAYVRDGLPVHLIRDPDSGRVLEVGVREHFVLSRLDGRTTREQIAGQYARTFGRALGPAAWQQVLGLFAGRGLLAGSPVAAAPPAPRPEGRFTGSIRLTADAGTTIRRAHRLVRPLLHRWFLVAATLTVLAMLATAWWHRDALLADTAAVFGQPVALLAVVTVLWAAGGLHEIGHGVVAHHYGATVSEIGVRWQLPKIIMYCRVDDLLFMRSRRHQVATAAAGVAVNLLLLVPILPAWLLMAPDDPVRTLLGALLLLGLGQAALFLLPLPPMDGYRILAQALGILQYAEDSRRLGWRTLLALVCRGPRPAVPSRTVMLCYLGYAIGATALIGGLVAGVATIVHHVITSHFGPIAGLVSAGLAVLIGMAVVLRITAPRREGVNRT